MFQEEAQTEYNGKRKKWKKAVPRETAREKGGGGKRKNTYGGGGERPGNCRGGVGKSTLGIGLGKKGSPRVCRRKSVRLRYGKLTCLSLGGRKEGGTPKQVLDFGGKNKESINWRKKGVKTSTTAGGKRGLTRHGEVG